MAYIVICTRTIFFYFTVVIIYRLMGKREVGQLGIVDLIISFLMAELVAIGIENYDDSILIALLPIIVLTLIQIGLAFIALKNPKVRVMLDGKPTVIIKEGKINFPQMLKQRYSLDDLLAQLRDKGIRSLEEVEYAILEANGTLSVFKYNFFLKKTNLPLPLILDGTINYETLKLLKKDKIWLDNLLIKEELNLSEVFYAFNKGNKNYIIKKD